MAYAIVFGFIALDVISGVISAIKAKTWTSTKMREGLFHKVAIILFIALAILCDYGQRFINLGFSIPLVNSVLIYVGIMEIGSIGENVVKINPELKEMVLKLFKKES